MYIYHLFSSLSPSGANPSGGILRSFKCVGQYYTQGDEHGTERLKLGKLAIQTTDITIVVCPKWIQSFIDGLTK